MKYKVGDELVLKGKIVSLDTDYYPYEVKFGIGNERGWLSEDMIESSKVVFPEQRRKEIEETIKALNEELESLK